MSQTRIRIDLTQGIIEAEGSEEFVQSIYADFKELIQQATRREQSKSILKKDTSTKKPKKETKKKRKAGGSKETPKIVKDLDLSGKGDKPSLKDFYGKYSAKTNFEKNLIFCYYLEHIIKHTPITVDDVFTCYRKIPNIKSPKALPQSLNDTGYHKGWLDTSSLEDIKVPIAGMNHLEHDIEKTDSDK